jgi:hypothetical protein
MGKNVVFLKERHVERETCSRAIEMPPGEGETWWV